MGYGIDTDTSHWWDYTTKSPDGGRTFTGPVRRVGFTPRIGICASGASAQRLHVLSTDRPDSIPRQRIQYSSPPLWSGSFDSIRILDDQIYWIGNTCMVFAKDGTGMILSMLDYAYPAPGYEAVGVNVTYDDGQTWSPLDTLLPTETAWFTRLQLLNWGSRWLACWEDTIHHAGFSRGGVCCAFSPNRGRFWYPNQQIEGSDHIYDGSYALNGDMEGSRILLYLPVAQWQSQYGCYYLQWEGHIQADTIFPVITTGLPLPDEVAPGAQVQFLATAMDNDTVWDMGVLLRRWGSSDSIVVPLSERVGQEDFRGTWTVPQDTAGYYYDYRAEDRWENWAVYPDTGDFFFHTPGWSKASDFILHSSSFIL